MTGPPTRPPSDGSRGPTRRELLVLAAAVGGAASAGGRASARTQAPDLVIKGGHVIDPARGLSAVRDVAIADGRIQRVAADVPAAGAGRVIDARGRVVTPGLVDLHVHVYDAVVPISIEVDGACLARGTTTAVDGGSSGANTFAGFRKHVIERARTRVFALLNISKIGLADGNEYSDLRFVDPGAAVAVIERHRDVILGLKVRMTPDIVDGQDLEVLRRARQAADRTRLPIMVHIGGGASPLERTLELLRPGDVVTHALHGRTGQILDATGRILPAVADARRRGIVMDIGHGSGNLSFAVAERAAAAGWFPDTISSDIHSGNVAGPVVDLPTTLSKFLMLGMSLEAVIDAATRRPAEALRVPGGPGTLADGAVADVAILAMEEGRFEFTDSLRQTRTGARRLAHVATIRAGQPV
ncbi:MAG: amidohydrolase/deacetylase family metallohydrolase [Vicinamibacterales bacterium]